MPDPSGMKKSTASSGDEHHVSDQAPSTFLPDYASAMIETVRQPLVLLDSGLRVLVANAAFYRTFGGTPAHTRRRSLYDLAQGRWDSPELHTVLQALQEENVAFENHEVRVTIDGQPRVFRLNARRLSSSDSDSSNILLAFEDVTELLRVEEGMRNLARMEAIGQLAGGVAHEINNQMMVLQGFMAFATRGIAADDPKRKDLQQAERAANHVVYVTRQLLNFSRKQMIRQEVIDPWRLLVGMEALLRRVLGSGIQVKLVRKDEVRSVRFDADQLGEIFINLALNAGYAMGHSGTLEITLSAVEVGEPAQESTASVQAPGRYIRFEVRDTGAGMDEDTRRHAFEPFFTTKPVGEGTGLGLASVFGAVVQNGGFLRVESQLGVGTTFIIDLPEVASAPPANVPSAALTNLPRGDETIIVAEDEEGVRNWISRLLRDCGYTVLEARDGAEALRLYDEHAATVGLVLTDLVMQGVDGREVGERLAARATHLPVLYMSAYTEDEIDRRHMLAPTKPLLLKPLSASRLAQAVRAALDGRKERRLAPDGETG